MSESATAAAQHATGRIVAFPAGDQEFDAALLKLRTVLLLISAPHGEKISTARDCSEALRARGIKASPRSLCRWRRLYKERGFAGLVRLDRIDRGQPRRFNSDV